MNFEEELDIIKQEVHKATCCYNVGMQIRKQMNKDKKLLDQMNNNAEFWKVILHSLQNSYFIILGRIFDKSKDTLSINKFLNNCARNYAIFSEDALKKRKADFFKKDIDGLNIYISGAFIPKQIDFKPLQQKLKKAQKTYKDKLSPIRSKIMAHNIESSQIAKSSLFSNYRLRELEFIVNTLNVMCNVLWELYHNGRKPNLESYDTSKIDSLEKQTNNILSIIKNERT